MTDAIRKEIYSCKNLPDGWHFGEGVGATDTAVDTALKVNDLMIANSIETIKVFPEIDGGIMVSGYLKKESLEVLDVSCRPDGTMEMGHEIDNADVFEDMRQGLRLNDVEKYLEKLNCSKKNLSGFCTPNISVRKGKDLQVRLSSLPVGMQEFQSLVFSVPVRSVKTSAVTSENTIKTSRVILLYSGESNPETYQNIQFSAENHQQPGIVVTATSGNWEEASVEA